MSRWKTLTTDHIKAAGHGNLIDRARTLAVGGIDPVEQAIVKITARVRRSVAAGNVLDQDETKIPGSLEDAAVWLIIAALAGRIGLALSVDQKDAVTDARAQLNTILETKAKVELADNAPNEATFADTGTKVAAVNVPRRLTGRGRNSGL